MRRVMAKNLQPGDKILASDQKVLTVKSVAPSMVRGELMINHDGDPDWSSVLPNKAVSVVN
jgi:hypothetical protein